MAKRTLSTDSWALPWSCSSWRANQTAFMSLFCFGWLTPLVSKSTTSIPSLANMQPSPFVYYFNISFDLHPSHLLRTPPDRDWHCLDVSWYIEKVNSISACHFGTPKAPCRHSQPRPQLAQGFLWTEEKPNFLISNQTATCGTPLSVPVCTKQFHPAPFPLPTTTLKVFQFAKQ